ncbi:hypothetical protein CDL15_Pgr024075 [Punica granatum]|uniref:Uncharacterized protein n=1 Tax=Punica granatum TaxID=22663 RepID=A0A218XWW9_PUNGR|nr:hypothetical protein CDL15_Pgr024075 [Punica granatum]
MTSKTMTRTKTKAMVMARKAYGRTSWLSPSREVMTVVAAPSVEVQNTHPKVIISSATAGLIAPIVPPCETAENRRQRGGFAGPSDRRGRSRRSLDGNSTEGRFYRAVRSKGRISGVVGLELVGTCRRERKSRRKRENVGQN